jgi:cysteine synthase
MFGTRIVVTEPIECPTLLCNGYGEHNIQGIGDKHVTLIHNVFNTDFVIGVSESASDLLNLVFNTDAGRAYAAARYGLDARMLGQLSSIGLSGLANLQAAIKYAKHCDLGSDDVVLTVATDGGELYRSEIARAVDRHCRGRFEALDAAEACGRVLSGCEPAHVLELTQAERSRIFNLGYYTWVEQRGIPLPDFDRRRRGEFWDEIARTAPEWDRQIAAFNAEVGAVRPRQLVN